MPCRIVDDFKRNSLCDEAITVPSAGIALKTLLYLEMFRYLLSILKIWIFRSGQRQILPDMTGKPYLENIKNDYAEKYAINNKVYSVPLTANLYGIYYNKTEV